MKCFITGMTGFAGSYLSEYLTRRGAEVLGIGLREFRQVRASATLLISNILDLDRLCELMNEFRPDYVYHLAALVHPARSREEPHGYYLVNVQGTVNLLEAVRRSGCDARVLLVSSSEVYGNPGLEVRVTEDTPPAPVNPYGSSKLLSEGVGRQYRRSYGCRVVTARPFNHSGPGQSEDFVISDFCRQIASIEQGEREPKILVGNLAPVREFLDVRDVVSAYVGLAEKGVEGEAYNICRGEGTEIREILRLALAQSRLEIEVVVSPEKYRPCTGERVVGSNRKLRSLLNWTPRYTLEQTIQDTLDYWRNRHQYCFL